MDIRLPYRFKCKVVCIGGSSGVHPAPALAPSGTLFFRFRVHFCRKGLVLDVGPSTGLATPSLTGSPEMSLGIIACKRQKRAGDNESTLTLKPIDRVIRSPKTEGKRNPLKMDHGSTKN